jgi:hypothetical protein
MFLNSNTSLSIYFFCKSRTQVITLYSGYVCVILCINASVLAPRRSGTSQAVLPSLHCPSTCQHAPLSQPSLPLLIPMASCLCSLVARAGPDNGEGRCKRRAWTPKLSDEEKAWAFTPSVSEQLDVSQKICVHRPTRQRSHTHCTREGSRSLQARSK